MPMRTNVLRVLNLPRGARPVDVVRFLEERLSTSSTSNAALAGVRVLRARKQLGGTMAQVHVGTANEEAAEAFERDHAADTSSTTPGFNPALPYWKRPEEERDLPPRSLAQAVVAGAVRGLTGRDVLRSMTAWGYAPPTDMPTTMAFRLSSGYFKEFGDMEGGQFLDRNEEYPERIKREVRYFKQAHRKLIGSMLHEVRVDPWHDDEELLTDPMSKFQKKIAREQARSADELTAPMLGTPYDEQLEAKRQRVQVACSIPVPAVLPSPITTEYRNTVDLTYGLLATGEPGIGYNATRRVVADALPSSTMMPLAKDLLREVFLPVLRESPLAPYDDSWTDGYWRSLILRTSLGTGEALANVIVNPRDVTPEQQYQAEESLRRACEVFNNSRSSSRPIKGLSLQQFDMVSVCPPDSPIKTLYGGDTMLETFGETTISVQITSFLQANTPAATLMFQKIADRILALGKPVKLLDVCCGAGSIGLFVGRQLKRQGALIKVIGIESHKPGIDNATRSAELNDMARDCSWIHGDVRYVMPNIARNAGRDREQGVARVAIVDPPRAGLLPVVWQNLLKLGPDMIVYIACNPDTVKVAERELTSRGSYRAVDVQPVDLFPQTPHIETVVFFEKTAIPWRSTEDAAGENWRKRDPLVRGF